MSLPAQQYAAMRGALRGALSANDPLAANPSDGEVLGFFAQLLTDASGAAAPGTSQLAEISIAAARMLTSNNPATVNPTDADVVTFWGQLSADAGGAAALSARRYLALRAALRGALSANYPGVSNPSEADVLGYFSPYAVTLVPISDAFWSTGGWWDLSTIAGANGAAYAAATPSTSAAGLGSFTPGFWTGPATPTIYDGAIGGKRGLVTSQTQNNYLENDALAAVLNGANKTWTVVFDYQQNNVGVPTINNAIVGWGSAGGIGAQDNAKFYFMNAATGGSMPESLSLFQAADVGFTATQNNLSQKVSFDYFRFEATYDGATLVTYINGVAAAVVPTTWQAAAMVLTKMMWGAWPVNGVGFDGSNGYIRRLGVRAGAATALQVAAIDANMVANDYTLPQTDARVPGVIFAGASVANGSHDAITNMGWRYDFSKYVQDNRRSWTTQGGVGQGFYALRNTPATAGTDAPTITAQVLAAVTARTRLVVVDLGDQEIDSGQNTGQVQAAVTTAVRAIRTGVYAVSPSCAIAVNTICPLSEAGFNAVCIATNAALPGIWTVSDAEFPGRSALLRWDANTAIGGPNYVQANYNAAGDDHPNSTGYRLLGAAMMAVLGPVVDALSPT